MRKKLNTNDNNCNPAPHGSPTDTKQVRPILRIFAKFTIVKSSALRIFAKLKTCKCKQRFIPLYANKTTMKPFITFSTARSLTLKYMIHHQCNNCRHAHFLHTAGIAHVQNAHFLHTEKFWFINLFYSLCSNKKLQPIWKIHHYYWL